MNDWEEEQRRQAVRDEWFRKTIDKARNTPPWVDKGADILSAFALACFTILFGVLCLYVAVKLLDSLF